MRVCPTCRNQLDDHAKFCDNCGEPLSAPVPPGFGAPANPSGQPVGSGAAAPGACPSCGFNNPLGSMFCDNCGVQLPPLVVTPPPLPTPVPPPNISPAAPPPQAANQGWQNSIAPSATVIEGRLAVKGSGAVITVPANKTQIVIGREDPVDGIFPEVDMNPHDGENCGVSRRHALLVMQDGQLYIEDLNSTNYTFLNKNRLQPKQRYPVKDGDEIRFGRLVTTYSSH